MANAPEHTSPAPSRADAPAVDDIHQTRVFRAEKFLMRQWPYALLLIALGGIVLALMDHDGSYSASDRKALIAAFVLIAAGFAFIIYTFVRDAKPHKPSYELSPQGITNRLATKRELFIPWDEIYGIDTIDIVRTDWARVLRYGYGTINFPHVTVVKVSKRFYDQNIHIDSMFTRGPFWSYHFIPDADLVMVSLMHEMVAVSPDDMRDAVEDRWRAFSNNPNAKLPAQPRIRHDLMNRLSPEMRKAWMFFKTPVGIAAMAALVLALVLPAAYYFRYATTWIRMPDLTEGSRQVYLRDLLDKGGISARLANGQMAMLRRADISQIGESRCVNEITRNPAEKTAFGPAYQAHGYCTYELTDKQGKTALAIFKTGVEIFIVQYPRFDGSPPRTHTSTALIASAMPLDEADAKLCKLGHCAQR